MIGFSSPQFTRPQIHCVTTSHSLRVFRKGDERSYGSSEVKVTSPKIQNGVNEAWQNPIPLIRVKNLSEKAALPSRASYLSAGYDLSSAIEAKVPDRGKSLIQTDLSIAVPEGTYGRIAPRSGLAWKHSIDVGAGVIDPDCRGPDIVQPL